MINNDSYKSLTMIGLDCVMKIIVRGDWQLVVLINCDSDGLWRLIIHHSSVFLLSAVHQK